MEVTERGRRERNTFILFIFAIISFAEGGMDLGEETCTFLGATVFTTVFFGILAIMN
jgi:hypothetical protein